MRTFFKYLIPLFVGITASIRCDAATPAYAALDDIPGNVQILTNVVEFVEGTVKETVTLENGILTVGDESINIAEPTRTEVVTNGTEVVTNVYRAVYEDGLASALVDYAKSDKISSIEIIDGETITNWTQIAYLSDIPPDNKKADKEMEMWNFACVGYDGVILVRDFSGEDPLMVPTWNWSSNTPVQSVSSIRLWYEDDRWKCTVNGFYPPKEVVGSYDTDAVSGMESSDVEIITPLTFSRQNNQSSFIVYSDYIESQLGDVVTISELMSIAARITEDNLHTLDGVTTILKGMREEVRTITRTE